ncbi:MAG: hypothetical protein SFZ23_09325 [Planctomycetota bacterium]|nr:hypothetical protein [Planctomycetota bacterium]
MSKLCTSCGVDVTQAPRVKDSEGRYFCKACAAKAQAAAAPAPQVADEDAAIMAKLAEEAAAITAEACPECHRPWKKGSTLCAYCGHNTKTGKALKTRVLTPEVIKAAKGYDRGGASRGSTMAELLEQPKFIGLVFGVPVLGSFALAMIVPEALIAYSIAHLILSVAIIIWTLIDGFRTSLPRGLLLLLLPLTGIGIFFWPVHGLFLTESPRLRAIWIVYAISIACSLVLLPEILAQLTPPDDGSGASAFGQGE